MRFAFIAKHRSVCLAARPCEALDVSRSGFHAWLQRGLSARAQADEELTTKVRASFVGSAWTYGARRVWRDLLADGVSCGLHKVAADARQRLARAAAQARFAEGRRAVSSRPAANALDRQFSAERPNQKWIADFTYIWTAEGWLYVADVIDLFSRRVVGWSMKAEMTAQFVADALMMAIWRRGKPDALLHHSDQGSQYATRQFQQLMADNGVVCLTRRAGDVSDNAAMEGIFSPLKTERIGRQVYRCRDQARADVFDYVKRFYNPVRRRSNIGYLSPVEFERQVGLA